MKQWKKSNIINYFERKSVIVLKTINRVINLHTRCVYQHLSLINQNNNTKWSIFRNEKKKKITVHKQKTEMSFILQNLLREQFLTLLLLLQRSKKRYRHWPSSDHTEQKGRHCCWPLLSTVIFKGSQSHIAPGKSWETFLLRDKKIVEKRKASQAQQLLYAEPLMQLYLTSWFVSKQLLT